MLGIIYYCVSSKSEKLVELRSLFCAFYIPAQFQAVTQQINRFGLR